LVQGRSRLTLAAEPAPGIPIAVPFRILGDEFIDGTLSRWTFAPV
jgi:hypothetical protein